MKEFTYIIQDPNGIHAHPAGVLVKQANAFRSNIHIIKGNKTGDLKRIFSVMAMNVKHGDAITIRIIGEDEDQAKPVIEAFLKKNL